VSLDPDLRPRGEARRLTHQRAWNFGLAWTRDGRSIVFDSQGEDGHFDVWTIGVDGSGLRQVTHDPADDIVPSWSRDGRFLYFTSNRTGRFEVWRVAVGGGPEEPVTREGGVFCFESFDGRTLYYQRSMNGALLARPTAGGEEGAIRSCVVSWAWAVGPRGLYYEDCGVADAADSPLRALRYRDDATGRERSAATLETDGIEGLSVSPDGRTLVYGRSKATSDILMIENFR
jgi:Tol biopolymer transport system component